MALVAHDFGKDVLLTSREVVLIGEILRLEEILKSNYMVESASAQEVVEIALDQLQGVIARLSSEDVLVWGFVEQVSEWLRQKTLVKAEFGQFNLETMLLEARLLKGSELTEEEVSQFVEFANEIDEVRRGLEE
jgi:hypothetical protein